MENRDTREENSTGTETKNLDFIRTVVAEDLESNKYGGRVITRFPPEPNGYLHIGHAKSICLNFGVANEHALGHCTMRFDDTNPTTEDIRFVESIQQDVRWLGFDWGEHLYYASDYFEEFFDHAMQLIKDGKAYVDSLSEDEIRAYRGTVTEPGQESPHRSRSVEENIDLFSRMCAGEFPDGAHVLRGKIDMAAPNMKMRDPLLFRIRHAHHYRTGNAWCVYPMYDFAHPLSDAAEGVTHSICTLEFENNREIYDWILDNTQQPPRPEQYEFARLNLDYTVLSKRKLLRLVGENFVSGWDDPRMPTLAGMRRRGVTPEAIREFCERIGVAKTHSQVELSLLEHCIRDDLNQKAPRVMCVMDPLRVVITNYPSEQVELLDAPYYPHDVPKEGSRPVPFSQVIYIERDDFRENPSRKFFRLSPTQEVRLRYAYIIRCDAVVKDEQGEIIELYCSYDATSAGSAPADGRKIKGTIHWVSAEHALPTEVRLYDRLFTIPNPDDTEEGKEFTDYINPDSVQVMTNALTEPSIANDPLDTRYQFERQGYFWPDPVDSAEDKRVYNRIVSLRDSWAKIDPKAQQPKPQKKARQEKGSSAESEGKSRTKRAKSEVRDQARANTPELAIRFAHYQENLGLTEQEADVLTGDLAVTNFFDSAIVAHDQPQSVARWVVNELLGGLKNQSLTDLPMSGEQLGQLVALMDDGTISSTIGKRVQAHMLKQGGDPAAIVAEQGLNQVADMAVLTPIVDRLMADNLDKVTQYQDGKTGLMGFFVGQIMRETRGQADPKAVQELLQQKLSR